VLAGDIPHREPDGSTNTGSRALNAPNSPAPYGMPRRCRMGPLTITAGTTDPVVALSPAKSKSGSAIASIAA